MRISVFGIGYFGLVRTAVLAEASCDVICVDVDATKVECLRRARCQSTSPFSPILDSRNNPLRLAVDVATGALYAGFSAP